jgi:hypothetical protein
MSFASSAASCLFKNIEDQMFGSQWKGNLQCFLASKGKKSLMFFSASESKYVAVNNVDDTEMKENNLSKILNF